MPEPGRVTIDELKEATSSSDEDEDPIQGFMAASQVKPKYVNKLDKAVRTDLINDV